MSTPYNEEIIIRETTTSDSPHINRFFSSIPIEGRVNLKLSRKNDFFSIYKKLGLKFINFILEKRVTTEAHQGQSHPLFITDSNNSIVATASFLIRNRYIKSKDLNIAYACDLRVAHDRKTIQKWSRYFLPKMYEIKADENIDHFVSLINLTDVKSINAFLRPKSPNSNIPAYELIKKFNLVTVHGFNPFVFKTNRSINIQFATSKDLPDLVSYLKRKMQDYDYLPTEISNDIEEYIQNSSLYSFSNFLIAKDAEGRIIGCTHPVNSSQLQDYFPLKYDFQASNFRQFLKFISFFGLGRKMTKPYSSTNKEQTMNFFILHFLNFDHPEVLSKLIKKIYGMSHNNEFIVYMYPKNFYLKRPPRGSIASETSYGLFEIKKREETHSSSELRTEREIYLDDLWF